MTSRNHQGTATFIAERRPRWFAISFTAIYGAVVLWPLAAGRYRLGTGKWTPKWFMHIPGTALTAAMALVAVAVIWGWGRAWRMGLHLGPQGVTIRNYFRTYRFGWPDVPSLVDGSAMVPGSAGLPGSGRACWALSVLAADGRAVTATGTASPFNARPETLTAVRQAAECHGITARLTGFRGDWRGPQWQPYLLVALLMILFLLFLVAIYLAGGPPESCQGGCVS